MTKAEFFDILNKIESSFDCDFAFHPETGVGRFWCHQDAGVAHDVTAELNKNKIPVTSHTASFDRMCGRYYVDFKKPIRVKE